MANGELLYGLHLDNAELREKCLNCDKPECTNCLRLLTQTDRQKEAQRKSRINAARRRRERERRGEI